ncbi:MAG: Holliday junction resolvase RuvX [Candidatus Omnitrophica bacterium]|nr:Holliday junction resolvase RuvX [Candidatus Omnitrophota bacterium]
MILLGLDIGTVRIGVAKSDPLGIIAQSLTVIDAKDRQSVIECLRKIIEEEQIGKIIVGLPKNMDGTLGPAAKGVMEWVGFLAAGVSVPVETWDERLSTKTAERVLIEGNLSRKKRKECVDKLAAQVILQHYLDSSKR